MVEHKRGRYRVYDTKLDIWLDEFYLVMRPRLGKEDRAACAAYRELTANKGLAARIGGELKRIELESRPQHSQTD